MQHKSLYDQYLKPLHPVPTDLFFQTALHAPIKAVLFDVYGTLFISASGDISTVNGPTLKSHPLKALAKKYQIALTPKDLLSGLTTAIRSAHKRLKKDRIDYPEVNIEEIWMTVLKSRDKDKVRQFAREFELLVNPVYPMPDLEKTLRELKQKQIILGIISNAQFYTLDLFEYFLNKDIYQLGFHPDLIILSHRFSRAKPSPYLFELAADKLKKKGISADNVLYVGNDILNDIYAAQYTGFQTALFAGDMRSLRLRKDHEACKNIHPDAIITNLYQLADMI